MAFSCQTSQLGAMLNDLAVEIEEAIGRFLVPAGTPVELAEAMRYAVVGGGKRLRPALVHLSARAVCDDGQPAVDPMPAAVAVELVHCYSLVHDDLPAMDDDSLRRGRATLHVKFGEAMGILAGDALLTRAFELLSEHTQDPAVTAALVAELARSAGSAGMIAGQVADMALCEVPPGQAGLEYIHGRKTAALFAGAARMGGICGGATAEQQRAIGEFATDLGLAFQVKDDLLDATATSEELGKTPGKDAANDKRTYPALLGPDRTAEIIAEISDRSVAHLGRFGHAAEPLRALAVYLLERRK
ncbi:MAG: polyprenyl synthetase family protein [Planctomycetes bacterium]|nr:polyprenyl synthetase family protein [Planctomycetota bacterium]